MEENLDSKHISNTYQFYDALDESLNFNELHFFSVSKNIFNYLSKNDF